MASEICRVFQNSLQHDFVLKVLIRCIRDSSLYIENIVYHTMDASPLVSIPLYDTCEHITARSQKAMNIWQIAVGESRHACLERHIAYHHNQSHAAAGNFLTDEHVRSVRVVAAALVEDFFYSNIT